MVRILEKLRYYIFNFGQLISGQKIAKHLEDISLLLGNIDPVTAQLRKERILRNILSHTIATVPYYSGMDCSSVLKDFPVIDKLTIRNSFDSFSSRSFPKNKLITMITSGSTGTPFRTLQDKNKRRRNYADTIFFAQNAGFKIGYRLIYLKIWAKEKMKNPFLFKIQNIIPIDTIQLNDKQIRILIHRMEKSRSTYGLIGYASALEQISRFFETNQINKVKADVRSIIAISESLNDYTRMSLKRVFGIAPVSRYSNIENGIIAQEIMDDSKKYLINTASYIVEILKIHSNEAAEPGLAGRIVVTDLFNYGMPLIRYDTGDIGIMDEENHTIGNSFLTKIEGRKMDLLYNTNGELISSFIVYKNMWKYPEIIQYQLIQIDKTQYLFKINLEGTFKREEELIKEFKTYLGEEANFSIEYVNEIPLLASGKRKKIVNLMTN
jgi:phenylacetate-CoA ligase